MVTSNTNPRSCCGTKTETFNVACAGNEGGEPGNDVFYTFKLEKYCELWPTLTINSTGTAFDYGSTLRYKDFEDEWQTINNSKDITLVNQFFVDRGDLPPNEVEFELMLDANSTNATGNFELKISAVKQYSRVENGNTITCDNDFNSCCRIAVDFEDTASAPIVQPTNLGNSLDIRLYPNPANGTVNWEMNNLGDEPVHIELYDMLGKQLRKIATKESNGTINLHGISTGVYTVRIHNQQVNKAMKLVVQ